MTKPIIKAAITALFSTVAATIPATLTIADLGCSFGPNTFFAVSEIISIMIDLCNAKKHELPEFQVFLSDFNTLFSSFLPRFQEKLSEQMKSKYGASAALACFFNGVPGSFCGRLFARESLRFIHSSYSLHWLSQPPLTVSEEVVNSMVGCLRAIAEHLLVFHFGEEIINEVFKRRSSEQVRLVKEQRLSAPERTTVEKPDGLETEAAVSTGEWEVLEKTTVEKMQEERRCSNG
ncbi:salicylate carboxymethyltransferase-like [Eucalyptus grandis]|uniref:salicylate carboxymethyltransferase-like n=1 Tax=Eucalyptus grandis TaxID=71139 RepID=UPI00192EEA03|nr:salicylate carboxymethyltransferase-like [Eucalyptus grandis]